MSDTNDMRREFEAWFSDEGLHPLSVKRSGNSYGLAQAAHAWVAWQAAKECATAQQDSKDAVRYRLLKSESYEAVIPHGNTIGGFRTAWITKLHPGADFDSAIDDAIRQGGDT